MQVLLVEDSRDDADLAMRTIASALGSTATIEHATSLEDAVVILDKQDIHLIVLDLGLPDAHGARIIRTIHTRAPGAYLVVWTGNDDPVIIEPSLAAGADLVLSKSFADRKALAFLVKNAALAYLRDSPQMSPVARQVMQSVLNDLHHQLRTPMTVLSTTLATMKYAEPDLAIVRRNLERLEEVMNGIFNTASSEQTLSKVDLNALVSEAWTSIDVSIPSSPSMVVTQESATRRALRWLHGTFEGAGHMSADIVPNGGTASLRLGPLDQGWFDAHPLVWHFVEQLLDEANARITRVDERLVITWATSEPRSQVFQYAASG